jgi:hypothetical protein
MAAVELQNLPPAVNYDQLREILDIQALTIVAGDAQQQATALVILSADSAQLALDLLDGVLWDSGSQPIVVKPVLDVREWLLSKGPKVRSAVHVTAANLWVLAVLTGCC